MKRFNLKKVKRVANAVRKAAESMFKEGRLPSAYAKHLGGSCAECSYVLADLLGNKELYVEGDFEGRGFKLDSGPHCFVRFPDNTVVDVTATQFRVKDKVFIVPPTSKMQRVYVNYGATRSYRDYERSNLKWNRDCIDEMKKRATEILSRKKVTRARR